MDYTEKRWLHLREVILRRDGYQDQVLKRRGKIAQAEVVHHVFPVDQYPEYQWCSWNLISVTKATHNTLHDRETGDLTYEGLQLARRIARKYGIPFLRTEEMEQKRPYERVFR